MVDNSVACATSSTRMPLKWSLDRKSPPAVIVVAQITSASRMIFICRSKSLLRSLRAFSWSSSRSISCPPLPPPLPFPFFPFPAKGKPAPLPLSIGKRKPPLQPSLPPSIPNKKPAPFRPSFPPFACGKPPLPPSGAWNPLKCGAMGVSELPPSSCLRSSHSCSSLAFHTWASNVISLSCPCTFSGRPMRTHFTPDCCNPAAMLSTATLLSDVARRGPPLLHAFTHCLRT
mmetsp:Transcript_22947/g.64167  ORF Transcript_22947/g.64167 Transcript_22947/m.64167 type:complete len:230 (-) Transcript_22947:37-726(-)